MPHINWSKKVKICIRLTNMETVRVPVWVYVVCHIQRQCSWWHHWWPLQRPINGPTVSRSHCLGLTDKGNRGKGRCDCLMDNLFNNKWSHSTMFIGSKILFTFCYNTETKMTLNTEKHTQGPYVLLWFVNTNAHSNSPGLIHVDYTEMLLQCISILGAHYSAIFIITVNSSRKSAHSLHTSPFSLTPADLCHLYLQHFK